MTPEVGITWSHDVSQADWIGPRLHGSCRDTGSVIPEGFESYCRIFHPARRNAPGAPSRSWAELAQENGRIIHPEMQFHMISRPAGAASIQYELNNYINELAWGMLPLPELSVLVEVLRTHTTAPQSCWFCIWDGYGGIDDHEVAERVILPSRSYVLYSGSIEGALAPLISGPFTHSPNLWWPRGPRQADGRGQIKDMVMISERPAEVADRAVPGHWEGDLIMGKGQRSIGTLVERSTRYVMLFTLPNGNYSAENVRTALQRTITTLPTELRRSITWDQGTEMNQHARFTVDTGVQIYFCDPKSPWQRGSNENTNGLLRQYFPKRTEIAHYSQADLDQVAAELNGRPRQTLGWRSPSQALDEALR